MILLGRSAVRNSSPFCPHRAKGEPHVEPDEDLAGTSPACLTELCFILQGTPLQGTGEGLKSNGKWLEILGFEG